MGNDGRLLKDEVRAGDQCGEDGGCERVLERFLGGGFETTASEGAAFFGLLRLLEAIKVLKAGLYGGFRSGLGLRSRRVFGEKPVEVWTK